MLAAARELAEIGDTIRAASIRATETLTGDALRGALTRTPAAALQAERAVLRAVTNRKGLGYALAGGPVGTVGSKLGGMVGARSLAVAVMTTSLRLRIAAVTLDNPELAEDPLLRRLNEAVATDHEIEAARALCALVKDRGAARALTAIAPVFGEILALRALLDQNPLNDHAAWLIASGAAAATADPVTGLSNRAIAILDTGAGAARPIPPEPAEAERLRRTGSLLDFLTDLCVVGPTGRALIQTVTGPDAKERHVVLAPGMKIGNPDGDSPGDLLGAFSSTLLDSAPYSRALTKAVHDYGIPPGAELALIGHSAGGAAIMSLAQSPEFCARYTVTHVVAVGSPIDFKRPTSPRTWVASVTNQHDIIPSLDGQGAGTCFDLHPDWYVADYTGPGHEFPACHSIEHYTANITDDLHEVREHIDEQLRPYRGPVTRSQLYRLYDAEPAVAALRSTAATSRISTAAGPVELPVRCDDGVAVTAYFTVDADAAAKLLGGARVPHTGGRAIAAIRASDNRRTSLGAYRELSLGIVIEAPGGPRPSSAWAKPGTRSAGRGVRLIDAIYTTELSHAAAGEIWGHTASLGVLRVTSDARLLRVVAGTADETIMTLAGPLGRGLPAANRSLVVYSDLDGAPARSRIAQRGRRRAYPFPHRLRLTVGPSDHPLARHLRELGIAASPVLCLVTRSHRSRHDAPVRLADH
ncbi:hypothetical protein E1298_22280 [Actinomadura rubrisoli]|uniref:Fungal lipase-like domain-containing protein n=1 Tax=Actinomadura rubrisoli TaxID=2530368 RepID=A0A4R5BBT0_9ACTN|nr:hypothetical protein E1298_22280 [Actinomadura rubrisoli]